MARRRAGETSSRDADIHPPPPPHSTTLTVVTSPYCVAHVSACTPPAATLLANAGGAMTDRLGHTAAAHVDAPPVRVLKLRVVWGMYCVVMRASRRVRGLRASRRARGLRNTWRAPPHTHLARGARRHDVRGDHHRDHYRHAHAEQDLGHRVVRCCGVSTGRLEWCGGGKGAAEQQMLQPCSQIEEGIGPSSSWAAEPSTPPPLLSMATLSLKRRVGANRNGVIGPRAGEGRCAWSLGNLNVLRTPLVHCICTRGGLWGRSP